MTKQSEVYHKYHTFIEKIRARLIGTSWRILRNRDDVADALQNTLLTIWNKFDTIEAHPNPTALAISICTHSSLDLYRKRLHIEKKTCISECNEIVDESIQTDDAAILNDYCNRIMTILATLPERQADMFIMHHLQEMSYTEISMVHCISETTVRTHVARAKQKLKEAWSGQTFLLRNN